jgi:hypothetical protein
MGVIASKLLRTGQSIDVKSSRSRSYQHNWLVATDDPTMMQMGVLLGSQVVGPDPVPSIWTPYDFRYWNLAEYDPGSYLQKLKASRLKDTEDNFYLWKVTGTYDPIEPNQEDKQQENPLLRPIKLSLEWAQFSVKVTEDVVDGRRIVNSADDLFEDVEKDDARPVLVAIKNFATFAEVVLLARTFKNAVNNAEFYGAPAGTAKVESIVSGNEIQENDYTYYAATIRVQFTNEDESPDGWNLRLVNRGTHCYDKPKTESGASRVRVRNLLSNEWGKGEFLDFANLNYDGTQRFDGEADLQVPEAGDDPFRIYYPRDFSQLGIGGT